MKEGYIDEDQLLIDGIKKGETNSFNTFYEKYWKLVYGSAIKRTKNSEKAQDITQDVFMGLWLNKSELKIDNPSAYLYTAVRNKVLDLFEKEKRYVPLEQLLYDNIQNDEEADAIIIRNEFMHAYKALVESLPAQQKKIFKFFFDQDLSTEEIAHQMAISRKTVQNQLGRASSSLKSKLSHLLSLLMLL